MYLMVGLIVFMNVIKELSWEWEPRKMKKMSLINVSKSRLGGGKLGLWCVLLFP